MKKFIYLFCLLVMQAMTIAANSITGRIVDNNDHSALIGANISLRNLTGALILGVTTDEKGYFELSNVRDGDYTLTISFIGYENQTLSLVNLNKNLPLGEISMKTASTTLEEVKVTGQAIVHKIDRKMIMPTESQKKYANNGIDLLQRMQITGLTVHPLNKTVSNTLGENVQLRINGVEVSKEEIQSIRPADIIRIEYHDNPSLRYAGAAGVLDYIVKRREHGGYLSTNIEQGVNRVGYGNYNLSGKYYYNRSSFSIAASMERRDLEWNRENTETFIYPNHTLINKEIGSPTPIEYSRLNLSATYNYTNDKKSLLNITFHNKRNDTPHGFGDRNSKLYQEDKEYHIVDRSDETSNIPSIDIYYQLNLKNDQHLYLDLVGTYLNSDYSRIYSMTETGNTPIEIFSKTEGKKYSLIGEAIYERPLGKGKFSSGLKHTQSYMNNQYDGNINNQVTMNTAETYFFTEYQRNFGKWGYTLGIGGTRTYYKQKDASQEMYIFRPTLNLSYKPSDRIFLKYNAYLSGYAPSLSDLSDVEQGMDTYQVRRGNPHLKNVTYFSNHLTAGWNTRLVSMELSARYSYDHKPIMEETLYENGKFIRTSNNQKGLHRLNIQTNIKLQPWKEYFSISLQPFFNRYISQGNTYTHTHSNWGFQGNAFSMYKSWMLIFQMNTSYHYLQGETIQKGESIHMLGAGYNKGRWSIQAFVINPFTNDYHQEVVNLSQLASNRQYAYTDVLNRMFMVNLSFNLGFGKQQKDSKKRINNSDNDTGILSGTK